MNRFLSVEIGGTKLQVAVGAADGTIEKIYADTVYPEKQAAGILSKISRLVHSAMDGRTGAFRALGAGYGGPITRPEGRVICSHQIPGWEGMPLRQWFEDNFQLPCAVENDANVAALGEAVIGAGRGRNRVFYVTLGSGVGGGFIVDGKIYHGAAPTEAEIGHVRLDRNGATLESRCSGWAVDRSIRETVSAFPESPLGAKVRSLQSGNPRSGGEAACLIEAIAEEDPNAPRIIRDLCNDLALGLSHVVHLLNPDCIILGGGLSRLGKPLIEGTAGALRSLVMKAIDPVPPVLPAELGDRVVPAGGLILAAGHATGRLS